MKGCKNQFSKFWRPKNFQKGPKITNFIFWPEIAKSVLCCTVENWHHWLQNVIASGRVLVCLRSNLECLEEVAHGRNQHVIQPEAVSLNKYLLVRPKNRPRWYRKWWDLSREILLQNYPSKNTVPTLVPLISCKLEAMVQIPKFDGNFKSSIVKSFQNPGYALSRHISRFSLRLLL